MKKFFLLFILLHSCYLQAMSQSIIMKGVIVDSLTREPLPYVNLGIAGKNIGTTTKMGGDFQLKVPIHFNGEKLTLSHVGYLKKYLPLNEGNSPDTILLKQKESMLNEVLVVRRKTQTSILGVRSYSSFLWGTTQNRQGDIVELAQRINCPKDEVYLEKAKIYLRSVYGDSAVVRINIYKDSGNGPDDRLVDHQIIDNRKIRGGWQTFDLAKYNILLKEDFYISFEFLPQHNKPLIITTGGKIFRGNGYARTSSLGRWDKSGGAYSIQLEVSN